METTFTKVVSKVINTSLDLHFYQLVISEDIKFLSSLFKVLVLFWVLEHLKF